MKKLYDLTVGEYRHLVQFDQEIQKSIHDFLLMAYKQKNIHSSLNCKTAGYAMIFVLNGTSEFVPMLKEMIQKSVRDSMLDATFLKGNYTQVAEKYWNVKDEKKEFHNILFGDVVTNEGRKGNQAIRPGKATSKAMKRYIGNDIVDYKIGDVFIEIEERVKSSSIISEKKKEQMQRELAYTKRVLENFYEIQDEWRCSQKEFDEEARIRKLYQGSQKETLILARRGQGRFRA